MTAMLSKVLQAELFAKPDGLDRAHRGCIVPDNALRIHHHRALAITQHRPQAFTGTGMKALAIRNATIHYGLETLPARACQRYHLMFTKATFSNPAVVLLLENGFLCSNHFEVAVKHLERHEVVTAWHRFADEGDAVLTPVTADLHLAVTRVGELDA